MENIEKRLARCLRMLLAGKVTWDHLIEEFKGQKENKIVEAVELLVKATENTDRYSKAKITDKALKRKIDRIIEKLEQPG